MVATRILLLATSEDTFVSGAVHPTFDAKALLQIVGPLTSVAGAARVVVGSMAASQVSRPLADEDISITSTTVVGATAARNVCRPPTDEHISVVVCEAAIAGGAILHPLTLEGGAIRPMLLSVAMALVVHPLTSVHSSTFKNERVTLLELKVDCRVELLNFKREVIHGWGHVVRPRSCIRLRIELLVLFGHIVQGRQGTHRGKCQSLRLVRRGAAI
mmetsp:Transcript_146397/g.469740  ORF Transcript_146397/g.469740 Transcript_146397/m.469740 type:complete len:216 (+) Transcript_146397:117-764(+)